MLFEMKYDKPVLTVEEQAKLLISRGLIATEQEIIEKLTYISYYRFSSYLYPFRECEKDVFKSGTTFEMVWQQYTFDRKLRLLVFNAIELIEIALRTRITNHFCLQYGSFAYLERNYFPKFSPEDFQTWTDEVCEEISKSKDYAVTHFEEKYGDSHDGPPLWIAAEFMTFGKIVTLCRKIDRDLMGMLAKDFHVVDAVFSSWLLTLNETRNVCAHHSRLWNRILKIKPKLPNKNKYSEWHTPIEITNNKMFSVLTIINYVLMQIAPEYSWRTRLNNLLVEYPSIPIERMGFPENWEQSPLWKK
ncbi:MAG: CAAX protease [Spirochaetia bacterium]|nr:CAAX protease [Spirochaetia bacterium]